MITDLHILDAWKQTYNAVGIQFLQAELNARKHDIGCTGRNQVDIRSVILPRLDPASRKLTDDLVAVDVFNAAQETGAPVTMALVGRVVDDLLTHPPECGCGRCEAAAIARVGDVWNIASGWQRAVAATKTTHSRDSRHTR